MNTSTTRLRCDRTPVWTRLQAAYDTHGRAFDLRQAFAEDPQRFAHFSQQAPYVFGDLSKNLLDTATAQLLLNLAEQCGVAAHRDAMFRGDVVNATEGRKVLHVALRARGGSREADQAGEQLARARALADELRRAPAVRTTTPIGCVL